MDSDNEDAQGFSDEDDEQYGMETGFQLVGGSISPCPPSLANYYNTQHLLLTTGDNSYKKC